MTTQTTLPFAGPDIPMVAAKLSPALEAHELCEFFRAAKHKQLLQIQAMLAADKRLTTGDQITSHEEPRP